jgi:cysteinyl-tRNA synthetase
MREIKLYNTLGRKIEIFKPIKEGQVSMYHCGPTVYDRAHIGNLRSYVFADTLRRTMEYNDLSVTQAINITDIGHLVSDGDSGEDKMTKALIREKKPLTMEAMYELASHYFDIFKQDLNALNIEMPQYFPRASEHIKEDIELIQQLENKGFAYKAENGLYFNTENFPDYAKIVGGKDKLKYDEEFARVKPTLGKKNHLDFILWKFDEKIGWESPWGKGFPGWHIECSAMARKYLGQPFDIHTGGIDHIPVHHNNEIAQSECAYDTPLANIWMHNAFITIDNSKMAKSAGNFITLQTLIDESISALSYRYWLLTSHYRSPVNFSFDAVRASQTALIRLLTTMSSYPDDGEIVQEYKDRFIEFINNDLDTAKALALVWDLIKEDKISPSDKKATLIDFDKVFGLGLDKIPSLKHEPIPEEIQALIDARDNARKDKDWAKADAMRQEIEERGFEVQDKNGKTIVIEK